MYSLYSHLGLYIGKANLLRRAGTRRGLAERLIEHMTGLLFPSSRDGNLPRYKVLRSSVGSIGFCPLRVFDTELRTLAAERALIVELKPSANGADWAALPSIRKTWKTPATDESGAETSSTSCSKAEGSWSAYLGSAAFYTTAQETI